MAFGISAGAAALIGGGVALVGGLMGSNAARSASSAQSDSASRALASQQGQYDQTRADNAGTVARGNLAGNRLSDLMGLSGNNTTDPAYGSLSRTFGEQAPATHQFGATDYANDFVSQNGLQFGLDEGQKGVERQQQASGGLLSGATLKALTRFGNDYGTKNTAGAYDRFMGEQGRDYGKYTDRYNRFNTDSTNQFNRLSGVAGTGQQATNTVGAAGQNYANNSSQIAQGLGNAQGASAIAQGNAWSGALQGGVNNYQQNRLINAFTNQRGGSGQSVWGGGNAFSDTGNY